VPEGLDPHYSGYLAGAGSGPTLGQACQKIFNWAGASGDVSQGTAGSMPLLLAHTSGNNYAWFSGVTSNYCSTPNAAANQITGDIEIIGKRIKIKDYSGTYAIASKGDQASNRGWVLRSAAGTLQFYVSYDGTSMVSVPATVSLSTAGYTADTSYFFKVTRVSSTGIISFYGSPDGVTYTQIGASVTSTTGASFNSTGLVYVGTWANVSNDFLGSIGGVTISNIIGGSPVVDFNPNTYNAATSQTNWTSTTGEVWTLNVGTATTGYKACIVSKTIVMGDGVDDTLKSASITINQPFTYSLANKPLGTTNGFYLDSSASGRIFIYQNGATNTSAGAPTDTNCGNIFPSNSLNFGSFGFNGASGFSSKNNAAITTRNYGTNNLSGLSLLSGYSGGAQNCIINTLIITNIAEDITQRASMYNIIRQLNNNAF